MIQRLVCLVVLAGVAVRGTPMLSSPAEPLLTTVNNPSLAVVPHPGEFDAVARLVINNGIGCSGALLWSGMDVLTAAHCVTDEAGRPDWTTVTASFWTPSGIETLAAADVFVNPGWTGVLENGHDLAIIRLATAASMPGYSLYLDDYLGPITLAGYGRSGTGIQGSSAIPFGTLRWGTNRYDDLVRDDNGLPLPALGFDFDDGTAAHDTMGVLGIYGVQDLGTGFTEVMVAPGDSGGPSFVNGRVVGIHSFGGRYNTCCDSDGVINSTFGEMGGDTPVSLYADWIEDTAIPEPGTLTLSAAAIAWIARRMSRRAPRRRV